MASLTYDFLTRPVWIWVTSLTLVVVLLFLLFFLGPGFGARVSLSLGQQSSIDLPSGFVIGKSLTMNIGFVVAIALAYFAILHNNQYRFRFYFILGVIALSAIMIQIADVIIVVDPVAEILALTTDTFIIYASNILAAGILWSLWRTRSPRQVETL